MRRNIFVWTAIAVLVFSGSVSSVQSDVEALNDGSNSEMVDTTGDLLKAINAYMIVTRKMDRAVTSVHGSTVDVLFVRKMLAHHQGAIDMAQIQMRYGMNAEARKIAQKISMKTQNIRRKWKVGLAHTPNSVLA